jgi:hypothetical protein
MQREHEYMHLAGSARRRGYEEQSAQLRAQWEILAATYVQLVDQSKKIADQSKKIDDTGMYYDRILSDRRRSH